MAPETKNCQNCKKDFVIEPDDFAFYEKMRVPAPTFCPECRMARKMAFRNERTLYKQSCALCGKSIISMYAPDAPFTIYCTECWWSDKWDAATYGRVYNFSKNFFDQFRKLFNAVPRASLYQTLTVNSPYLNYAINVKDSYMVFGGHDYENCLYSEQCSFVKDCSDVAFSRNSEFCAFSVDLWRCSKVFFSRYAEDCSDSYFLYDCRNCSNCFGCVNLRNKSHCIFNEQYSKNDYFSKLKEFDMGNFESLENLRDESFNLWLKYQRRFAVIRNSINCVGDNIHNSKNCFHCFDIYKDVENSRYSFFLPDNARDCYDSDHTGVNSELMYEVMSTSYDARVVASNRIYGCHDIYYSDDCHNSQFLFGCIGLKKREYCILNKQYTKEEYEDLVSKIVDQMIEAPYVDKVGRVYKFGEFFPVDLSPFAYNETLGQEYFSVTEEEAMRRGYVWHKPEAKSYRITLKSAQLPGDPKDVQDSITNEVVGCAHQGTYTHQCTTAFRIIPEELSFYRRMNLPLPRLCPNCRHYERLVQRNPLKLWHRKCQCAGGKSDNSTYQNTAKHQHQDGHCPNDFETSYSPERKEIIYCEQCYQAEVA